MKQVRIGGEARAQAVEALKFIADAVGTTLGPKGLSFIIERSNSLDGHLTPVVSKDGISVMKSFNFTDPIQHAVHNFCVQASSHTVYAAGDGTTSSIVLAAAIARAILAASPERPQSFAREVQKQAQSAIEAIGQESDRSPGLARAVALTSSNGDEEMIAYTMEAVENNPTFGSIIIERAPAAKERYRIVRQDGLTAGRGYNQHLQFAHSFSDKTAENAPFDIETPYVLLYDGDLISTTQLSPILNRMSSLVTGPWSLCIVAYEIGQEVANVLAQVNLQNKGKARVWASSIRISAEANSGWHRLQDLAAFTGSTIINHGVVSTQGFSRDVLGQCTSIQVSPEKTIFIGRSPSHWIPKRALQNEMGIENATTELDKERIRERNAELVSGLVKLVVGGGHLAGIQERADRCDDAIKAAQACLRSGALPGCGAAYIRAGELAGVGPELKQAFRCIHDQIMANFGHEPQTSFEKDMTVAITETGVVSGDFRALRVADSFDTISSVIRNATELGILFATLGGYSLTSDLHEIEQMQRVKSVMG